ncbi:Hypothetical protein Minf_1159 [Methylacidiphilum infernorum V4]|uniref:Uncharacterized protein n=1 Tax=Methylacidiphilum infernorum (isolate V4) TaxID=481448 RepID=B3DV61_METI4|nr:Hypothetical protein Minf_1159 [Methylacidiphilum infernorum V4]
MCKNLQQVAPLDHFPGNLFFLVCLLGMENAKSALSPGHGIEDRP